MRMEDSSISVDNAPVVQQESSVKMSAGIVKGGGGTEGGVGTPTLQPPPVKAVPEEKLKLQGKDLLEALKKQVRVLGCSGWASKFEMRCVPCFARWASRVRRIRVFCRAL